MDCSNPQNAGSLVSPCKRLKLASEDNVVKRLTNRKDTNCQNRLSQRGSILCMCQCESADNVSKTDVSSAQNGSQCEFHKAVDICIGTGAKQELTELPPYHSTKEKCTSDDKIDVNHTQKNEAVCLHDVESQSDDNNERMFSTKREQSNIEVNVEDIINIDGLANLDEYAPDVYGSECLASISASYSLSSINAACDEIEQTVVDVNEEQEDLPGISNRSDELVNPPTNTDETLKYNDGESADSESEESESQFENTDICNDGLNADEDSNTGLINGYVPVQSSDTVEVVPVKLKCVGSSSRPICSSTPLTKDGVNENRNMQFVESIDLNYPPLTTFKPSLEKQNVPKVENILSNSQPLCSSTPVSKHVSDLERRDTNSANDVGDKNGKRNIIDDILGLESYVVNEELVFDCQNDEQNHKKVFEKNRISSRTSEMRKSNRAKKKEGVNEKKKIKGTRTEKFKEYMGPGLTCNLNDENDVKNSLPKDFLKNTDIEMCTLTEYKGFGLTGPLPNQPLHASTPAPIKGLSMRDPNVMSVKPLSTSVKNISMKSITNRPAGTEGCILNTDGQYPSVGKNISEEANRLTQGKNSSQKSFQPSSMACLMSTKLATSKSRQTLDPALLSPPSDLLSGSSGQVTSGTSSALQPDDIYPSVSSVRSDKSDNCSTDRSDRSSKSGKPKEASVLQSFGQLKVSAYMNFGLLTVHVVQCRQLSTKWKSTCDSFVKMCLIPDDGKKPKCKTAVVQDSNNPLYDEKFSFELNEEDHCKRLMISVWHRDQNASVNEFLGCMSFGVRHLTNPKKEVSGWYYLLTEDIGRKKHLKVTHRQVPQLKVRHHSNIPAVNKDVWGTETHYLTLSRGKNGFGFSLVEACPVRVGRVDGSSPAETAGLQPGDIIIRLNKQNVSRSTATSVAKLVKNSSSPLYLEIHRQKPITYEHLEYPDQRNNDLMYEMNENDYSVPDMNTIDDEDKENEAGIEDETIYGMHPNIASLATSTPLPLLARGHRTVQTSEMRKQEAIHRLLSLELDFIDLMHAGMQRYSRPLRHCILSHTQHTSLFQNIEKLTTISEYHVKQMHDNAPSSFISEDTDTSVASDNHSFMLSIGLIYQSKVHMLCQAYDLYAKGVSKANKILSDLQQNEDFMKFVHDPPLEVSQPSIKLFIYQPVKHIRDLYQVIQDIFLNTSQDSTDYNSLKQVVEGLQECATSITNYSCERIESTSSLASKESKTSFTSSMKSRSSTCSSRSSSSKGHSSGPSCSIQTSKSIDAEVMKIQDKLVFSSNVPVFQLCQDDRHIIFSGDMFKWEGYQWVKVHMILFTDMILLTFKEADGYLRVLQEPTLLRDVTGMDAQRHHGTELVLYCKPRETRSKKLSLRAPSTEQKYAWKSLIEQRVFAVRGALEYYSSTSDLSSSSASAVII